MVVLVTSRVCQVHICFICSYKVGYGTYSKSLKFTIFLLPRFHGCGLEAVRIVSPLSLTTIMVSWMYVTKCLIILCKDFKFDGV